MPVPSRRWLEVASTLNPVRLSNGALKPGCPSSPVFSEPVVGRSLDRADS